MPKNDMWTGGVAMEPLSNMDSAGSCESVISMNSGYSEDSMEHLSPEERACLMYLEETIEALEVQEDSGFSNDEPDPGLQTDRTGQTTTNDPVSLKPDELGGAEHHEPPSQGPTADSKPGPHHSVLCVTTDVNGNPQIVTNPMLSQSGAASAVGADVIPPPSDFMDKPRLRVSLDKDRDQPLYPGAAVNKPGGSIDLEQLRQRAAGKRHSIGSYLSPNMSDVSSAPGPPAVSSGSQVSPPPRSPEPPRASPSSTPSPQMTPPPPRAPSEAVGSLITPPPPPPESPGPLSSPPLSESSGVFVMSRPESPGSQMMSPPPEWAEPRSPPVVAPKPKKLPANIVLKSHRKSVSGPDASSGYSGLSGSERMMLDPQRVRFEALRKLGLLRGDEMEPGPAVSPRLSPKTRGSWGAPPSPVSPAASYTPPATPSHAHVHSPPPVTVLQPPPVAVAPPDVAAVPDFVPAPAAFRDPGEPLLSEPEASAAESRAREDTPPPVQLTLTPPKNPGMKAATLERSGSGLSGLMAGEDSSGKRSPWQLRNTRPRPASLGSGKEFPASPREPASRAEPDSRRSLPVHAAFPAPRDSQKLPRSEGISVLICPRSENEEDRREALRKLGLLRD